MNDKAIFIQGLGDRFLACVFVSKSLLHHKWLWFEKMLWPCWRLKPVIVERDDLGDIGSPHLWDFALMEYSLRRSKKFTYSIVTFNSPYQLVFRSIIVVHLKYDWITKFQSLNGWDERIWVWLVSNKAVGDRWSFSIFYPRSLDWDAQFPDQLFLLHGIRLAFSGYTNRPYSSFEIILSRQPQQSGTFCCRWQWVMEFLPSDWKSVLCSRQILCTLTTYLSATRFRCSHSRESVGGIGSWPVTSIMQKRGNFEKNKIIPIKISYDSVLVDVSRGWKNQALHQLSRQGLLQQTMLTSNQSILFEDPFTW